MENKVKSDFITLIDKDLINGKITISKKALDILLKNAVKDVMKKKGRK
jgi:hypothetical protein